MAPATALKKQRRTPRQLVPLIKTELRLGYEAGMDHYRAAGAMLLEAKAQMAHGEFGPWCRDNFTVSKVMLSQYMGLVETEKLSDFTFRSKPCGTGKDSHAPDTAGGRRGDTPDRANAPDERSHGRKSTESRTTLAESVG